MNPNILGTFLFRRYLESFFDKEVKMDHTKMHPKYLDSPGRELSNGGLKIVAALLVRSGIAFSCAPTGKAIQL